MGGGIKTNPDDPVRQAASPPPFAKLSWERSPALTRACSALPGLEELPQGLPHRLHRGGVLLPDRVHQDAAAAAVQEQPGVQGNGGLRHADHQEERPARALQGRAPAVRRASPASPARARAPSRPLLNRSALCDAGSWALRRSNRPAGRDTSSSSTASRTRMATSRWRSAPSPARAAA